jgi:benzodiazapine receptor
MPLFRQESTCPTYAAGQAPESRNSHGFGTHARMKANDAPTPADSRLVPPRSLGDATEEMNAPAPTRLAAFALAGWILLSFAAALPGAWFMPGAWYDGIRKPSWNPPGWIFGPVWSTLYTLMGVAAWRVWRKGGFAGQRHALTLFLVQLSLNALWTPLFFGAHLMGTALAEILCLWIAIFLTTWAFSRADRTAGALLLPYLAWVSFAAFLNFTLWNLNR